MRLVEEFVGDDCLEGVGSGGVGAEGGEQCNLMREVPARNEAARYLSDTNLGSASSQRSLYR